LFGTINFSVVIYNLIRTSKFKFSFWRLHVHSKEPENVPFMISCLFVYRSKLPVYALFNNGKN
jgi:hypothetical protein